MNWVNYIPLVILPALILITAVFAFRWAIKSGEFRDLEAQAAEWNVVMAGAMISIVPPLLVLLLLQGAFVKGFALQQEK